MGVSTSAEQLAAKLAAHGRAIEAAGPVAVSGAAVAVESSITVLTAAATGGDMTLSGVGRKGGKLGVRKVVGPSEALLTATGPFHLAESDQPRHDIKPRGLQRTARGRQRKGAKALTIGGGLWASARNTGGSRGREPWKRGVRAGEPAAMAAFETANDSALKAVFG